MTTQWSGRPPIAYTETLYDSNILYDADIPYDGVLIQSTTWNTRAISQSLVPYNWDQSTFTWDSITFTWDTWGTLNQTTWSGRVTP